MIAYLGMSDKLPNLCYYNNEEYSFNRPYSEKTAELIDTEVKNMVNEQYERCLLYTSTSSYRAATPHPPL